MAFGASFPAPSGDRVMLISERSGFVGMAADAHLFDGAEAFLSRLAGMCLMTFAALQPTFRNRMVEVEPELVRLTLMALTAQDGVVELQQAAGLWLLLRLR